MDYYRVMLVDDEEEVRSAMERRIDWEEIGFKVVATAENGEDALEKAEKQQLDVVMTDIHMPFMDGLEMLRHLKEQMPGIKSVIFSGYDEFEYAKEAIKLEAEEYILKPIDAAELKQVFLRIKERLDEELAQKRNVDELNQYYQQSLPILKEQFLISLLEGRLTKEKIERYQKEYDFDFDSAFYCVGVLRTTKTEEGGGALDDTLLTVSLKRIVDEKLEDVLQTVSINYLDTVVVIARLKSTAMQKEFQQAMDRICKFSRRILSVATFAGIGRVYGNLEDVGLSYAEAQNTISYRFVLDDDQAVSIDDIEPGTDIDDYIEEKQIAAIIHEVKVGTDESLKKTIEDTVGRLRNGAESISQLHFFYAECILELARLARGHKLFADAAALIELNTRDELAKCKDMSDIANDIYEKSRAIKEKLSRERMDSTRMVTDRARQFIQEHYAEKDLSVERLCSFLNVSPTYFSALFKKEMGMSFVSYLTEIRMDQAKKLLDTTDEKSYIIAGMVGYEEPNYFSYVFKKHFGVSPSKYRNS